MERELFRKICRDVDDRKEWADRQAVWYRMRREGIRRINKPYPNAADRHFPLIEMAIKKLKPTCLLQIFANERLADFIAAEPQDTDDIVPVGWWFDYKMRQLSNFEDEIDLIADYRYLYGNSVMKLIWDEENKKLRFDAIEPIFIIVPDNTEDIRTAAYLVHVKHLSTWDYLHGPESDLYTNKSKTFLKTIQGGRPDADYGNEVDFISAKRSSEGITHCDDEDTIILWEIYERPEHNKCIIHTISPQRADIDIRPPFDLTYKHKFNPFVDFPVEKVGKSFYSSRGIAELGAPFQSYICKLQNGKADAIDWFNFPMLSASKDLPITQNVTLEPGVIIPFQVAPIQLGAPPISWDQEMANTRDTAEQLFGVPDFGMGEKAYDQGKRKSSDETATEINYKASVTNQTIDLANRVFRRKLGMLYIMAWELLCQKDKDLEYLQGTEYKSLDKDVKEKVESLRPSGSAGSWNIAQRWQKAIQRKAMYGKSPYVKQHELDKMSLELDEPGLVERLYQDPGEEEANQAEAAAKEIPTLKEGLPLRPKPGDKHDIHAKVAGQAIVKAAMSPKDEEPDGMKALMDHYKAHMQVLQQVNPQLAAQLDNQLKQALQGVMVAKQRQQQQKDAMIMGRPAQPMDQGAAAPPPQQPNGQEQMAPPQPMGPPRTGAM
jgi:hypothetical protein